ncbi:HTH domain-containing protein [Natronomonas sp. EA1]|uniref:HTH domain-containing protein n=1 Tax=Natronomonas sp. EA1 TaxID=3421655 RepID=UPI003EBBADFC
MSGDGLRVEFRMRDHTPAGAHERQQSVYERLQQLRGAGKITEIDVLVGGTRVPVTGPGESDGQARATQETYRAFEAWAARSGCTLAPAFDTRECGTLVGDEQREVLVFPLLSLALYGDDELRAVFPHVADDGVRTVEDGLDAIATGGWRDGTVAGEQAVPQSPSRPALGDCTPD